MPDDREARERAARYLVRSCVSLEKMTYVPQEGKIYYGDASDTKVYDALEFLALLCCHITESVDEFLSQVRCTAPLRGQKTLESGKIRQKILALRAFFL